MARRKKWGCPSSPIRGEGSGSPGKTDRSEYRSLRLMLVPLSAVDGSSAARLPTPSSSGTKLSNSIHPRLDTPSEVDQGKPVARLADRQIPYPEDHSGKCSRR